MSHHAKVELVFAVIMIAFAAFVVVAVRLHGSEHGRNCRCRGCWDRNLARASRKQREGGGGR